LKTIEKEKSVELMPLKGKALEKKLKGSEWNLWIESEGKEKETC
jgi:hypothetical protein